MGSALRPRCIPGARSTRCIATLLPSRAPGKRDSTSPNLMTAVRIVQNSRTLGFRELSIIGTTAASDTSIANKGTSDKSINPILQYYVCQHALRTFRQLPKWSDIQNKAYNNGVCQSDDQQPYCQNTCGNQNACGGWVQRVFLNRNFPICIPSLIRVFHIDSFQNSEKIDGIEQSTCQNDRQKQPVAVVYRSQC